MYAFAQKDSQSSSDHNEKKEEDNQSNNKSSSDSRGNLMNIFEEGLEKPLIELQCKTGLKTQR